MLELCAQRAMALLYQLVNRRDWFVAYVEQHFPLRVMSPAHQPCLLPNSSVRGGYDRMGQPGSMRANTARKGQALSGQDRMIPATKTRLTSWDATAN
jgi:hypothetical protein